METRGLGAGQTGASIGPLYLVLFMNTHVNFRLAEFRAGADYLDAAYAFTSVPVNRMPRLGGPSQGWQDAMDQTMDSEDATRGINVERPVMLVHLRNDDVARQLCERVTCIKAVWQQWASGCSVEEVQERLQMEESRALWGRYWAKDVSWRATIISYQRSLSMQEQRARVELFKDVLDFQGPIRMKGYDLDWGYIEEWTVPIVLPEDEEPQLDLEQYEVEAGIGADKKRPQRQRLLSIHVGRKVANGLARELVAKMDVKKRKYIGNTTMEAQMSLIQAGMALAGPGKVIYDPFAGTCSLLLAAAALGAHVLGSDIDGRMMRGKAGPNDQPNVMASATQYGVEHLLLDCVSSDISQHPWRGAGLFDAIVADPPYGVRAGAKRLGKRDLLKQRDEPVLLANGCFAHQQSDYVPPTKPYALQDLLLDLMNVSAGLLAPRGRLVFWMPTMIETDGDGDGDADRGGSATMHELQLQLTPDFRLIAHSLQDFGAWGRRLITLEKVQRQAQQEAATAVLPSPPTKHRPTSTSERIRATDDPNEFRNRVSVLRCDDGAPLPDRIPSSFSLTAGHPRQRPVLYHSNHCRLLSNGGLADALYSNVTGVFGVCDLHTLMPSSR